MRGPRSNKRGPRFSKRALLIAFEGAGEAVVNFVRLQTQEVRT